MLTGPPAAKEWHSQPSDRFRQHWEVVILRCGFVVCTFGDTLIMRLALSMSDMRCTSVMCATRLCLNGDLSLHFYPTVYVMTTKNE